MSERFSAAEVADQPSEDWVRYGDFYRIEARLSRAEAALKWYADPDNYSYAEVQETRPGGRARSYFTSPTADSARSESSAGELSVSHTPDNCDPQSCLASERESDG